MASEIDGVVEALRTHCAVNGMRDLCKESLKLLDATALHLEPDLRHQVSPGYPSPGRGFPARQVETAMPLVVGVFHILSNVGGISEIVVTNRAGKTAVMLIDKQVHRLRAIGAVINGQNNGVNKFIAW